MGEHIAAARRGPSKKRHGPKLPEAVVEECEKAFEAADETAEKSSGSKFDDNGVFAIVCRHDIPLFLANIDSPGEQQKYEVALIKHIMDLLPSTATVVSLYDIACVTDTMLTKVGMVVRSTRHMY